MHREPLRRMLQDHAPSDAKEEAARARILAFVRANADCFERSLRIGHVTGSAWLLDPGGTHALLTHHKKLGRWLQLGGHADGNPDVLGVALREAHEESGLQKIVPVSRAIFDVDVHRIPATVDEPEHDHFDIRFLLKATDGGDYRVGSESFELAWVALGEVPGLAVDESVLRMHAKWVLQTSHARQYAQENPRRESDNPAAKPDSGGAHPTLRCGRNTM